jgi:hypothetical protein
MMIAAACELAAVHGVADQLRFVEGDAGATVPTLPDASYDLGVCIGATHACGTLVETLTHMRRLARMGGRVLIGELYWRTPPASGLLEALAMEETDLSTLEVTLASGRRAGLEPLAHVAATPAEFEVYEVAQRDAGRAWCDANPSHPDTPAIRARTEEWWRLYETYTREAFGFAAFLLGVA